MDKRTKLYKGLSGDAVLTLTSAIHLGLIDEIGANEIAGQRFADVALFQASMSELAAIVDECHKISRDFYGRHVV